MNLNKNKKRLFIIVAIVVLLLVSFLIYNVVSKADTDANKIAIKNITLTGIDTGGNNSSDGFDYNDSSSYTKISGYIPGSDSKSNNRIVRSFDEIKYHFDFSISGKNDTNDYEERSVSIKVTIPDSISKYVSFDPNSEAGTNTYTYTFDGIDTYGSFQKDITLYILGAPNGTSINPKFEIQESTNIDSNYVVTLGNTTGDIYNYRYDSENSVSYTTTPTVQGFLNYMPTVVSSKTANLKAKLIGQTSEGQKAVYNNKTGRYLTYVLGLELVGDELNGIKGYTMPNGDDITLNVATSQNGSVSTLTTIPDWARLYGTSSVAGIEPVVVSMPYSASNVDVSKRTKIPGAVTLSLNKMTIDGYGLTYTSTKANADGSKTSNSEYIIGTYAISVFSERASSDGKNDITTNMSVTGSAVDTAGTILTIDGVSASAVNKYYENADYSLTGEFYDQTDRRVSSGAISGTGAVSKGTTLVYKTIFNYNKTLSDQGLKEVIKFDTNAFRVIPLSDKEDIRISVEGSNLTSEDFEIKYVTGDFNNSNYNSVTAFSRISSEDLSTVQASCSTVSRNLNTYSINQIMNLYGGPCISPKEEVHFDKISDAKDGNSEIPITKVIVQTKKGIVLPDSARVIIQIGVRVRNVSDLTQTYQAVSTASSSDYDTTLTYYSPRVTSDENSVTNPNNYNKTVYVGNNISSIDEDSPWGDSLKIVNFTSREEITVTNKNTDGTIKTTYNSNKGETITYSIKTIINDQNEQVGADDTWWINSLRIYVTLPSTLTYIKDVDMDKYLTSVDINDNATVLVYTLPYTKPNQNIPEINFKATIKPTLKGSSVPIVVTSSVDAININGEKDTSYFGYLTGSFTIYATGIENVIVSQKIGEEGSVIEKNGEFSYLLNAYNNTSSNISDYSIVDILPSNNDKNGSNFSGSYKVKVTLPESLAGSKIYCSTQDYSRLSNEVFNNNNEFEECDITETYVNATAIKITDIIINKDTTTEDIKVSIKTKDNNYDDKYINSFVGASQTYSQNESNKIEARVVSRKISGRVFIDNNSNGKEDSGDTYLKDIPLTIYKLNSQNEMTKIDDTVTNDNGYYSFKNLDVGRYKIRASYDKNNYDLTLRYATEDRTIDSDAYKIEDGLVEISNYRNPNESDGIKVTREIESVTDMNIGLLPIKTFGFNVDKFITKVDLTYNGATTSKDYPNLKLVKEDVKNSWNASAKVYYGIKIENNSNTPGYVKLINESIPDGSIFDSNDPYNAGWINNNGTLQNVSLANDLINPGETRYVAIALNIPAQAQGRSYVNKINLQIERYEPEELAQDVSLSSSLYEVGEAVNYAGISWHVISTQNNVGEQILTLLADSSNTNRKMAQTSNTTSVYKWSDSLVNKYINSDYIGTTTLNTSALIDNSICDDASGLPIASYGGTLQSEGTCQSGIYNTYKIRLLTEREYNNLQSLTDKSWLYGNGDFWLENSVFIEQLTDVYGKITNSSTNLAKYINKNLTSVSITSSSQSKEVRPVITISSKNIIPE